MNIRTYQTITVITKEHDKEQQLEQNINCK